MDFNAITTLARENEELIKEKTKEEIEEFQDALVQYENYEAGEEVNEKESHQLLEKLLEEIGNVKLLETQHLILGKSFLSYKNSEKLEEYFKKYQNLVSSVINYKAQRTLLRNKIDWYIDKK